jgi:hypothetical protein
LGIADEYPKHGTQTAFTPWGYDTFSRRFCTWYNHETGMGKLDPMSGGERPSMESCFPGYVAYQAKTKQSFAIRKPVLLSSMTSGVESDGAYIFNQTTHKCDN